MSKVKVRMTVKSWGRAPHEEFSVDSEIAEQLVANGQAAYVSPAKQAEAAEAQQGG